MVTRRWEVVMGIRCNLPFLILLLSIFSPVSHGAAREPIVIAGGTSRGFIFRLQASSVVWPPWVIPT